jgi:hypothetical protein
VTDTMRAVRAYVISCPLDRSPRVQAQISLGLRLRGNRKRRSAHPARHLHTVRN